MPRPKNLFVEGLKPAVDRHTEKYGGMGYEQLIHYFENGDHFGRPYSLATLAKASNCNINTMVRWKQVYEHEKKIAKAKTPDILSENKADKIVAENIKKAAKK